MSRPGLAAITLDVQGGGVATVARLLRRVLVDHWGSCALATLVENPGHPPNFDSGTATRVAFGLKLASQQMLGRCDWLFYSHLSLAQVQRFVPTPFRRPYAVFLHDIEAWNPMSAERLEVLQQAFMRVANSTYTAKRVMEAHPGAGPVYACPLALEPIDSDDLDLEQSTLDLGPHAVLVVGRMSSVERYKGHDQLLEAWPDVLRQVPDARLVFVGTGDDIPRLEAKARDAGVGHALVCPGFVSKGALTSYYQRAAAFAMPSRREGFGLVYLEAMSHGLPCIGSIHDAAGDVVQDGISGFLVNQADIAGLADRIVLLLGDEERRKRMGAQGARRVSQLFTYDRFASRLVSLIPREFGARAAALASARRSVT